MLDRSFQQALILFRVVGLEIVLPPDLALHLGPADGEGVVHRATGAGGIGVEHERAVETQLGGECFLIGVGTVQPDAPAVVGNGLPE